VLDSNEATVDSGGVLIYTIRKYFPSSIGATLSECHTYSTPIGNRRTKRKAAVYRCPLVCSFLLHISSRIAQSIQVSSAAARVLGGWARPIKCGNCTLPPQQ